MHIVTLSFDDGHRESSIKTAEIYEKFNLSACINVIATGHHQGFKVVDSPPDWNELNVLGDFSLWNELQERGHEIMPHGYAHRNKQKLSFEDGKDHILKCLDVFTKELKGFDPKKAVFNFPYNLSTPELEEWLPSEVRAFRSAGSAINPLPQAGMVRLSTSGFGPKNAEAELDRKVDELLKLPDGWLIFNTHGMDEEGWGPIRSGYLEELLGRIIQIPTVKILPSGKALQELFSN